MRFFSKTSGRVMAENYTVISRSFFSQSGIIFSCHAGVIGPCDSECWYCVS